VTNRPIDDASIVVRVCAIRLKPDGFSEIGNGLIVLLQIAVGDPAISIGFRVVRSEPDRSTALFRLKPHQGCVAMQLSGNRGVDSDKIKEGTELVSPSASPKQ
jgi:hypothetical protein